MAIVKLSRFVGLAKHHTVHDVLHLFSVVLCPSVTAEQPTPSRIVGEALAGAVPDPGPAVLEPGQQAVHQMRHRRALPGVGDGRQGL